MKRILAVGVVALAAACSSQKDEHPIRYAAPRAPVANETSAVGAATTTLGASFTPLDPTLASQPTYGLPGLADQLAAQLGTIGVAGAPSGASAKLAGAAVRQAFDMSQMPACVQVDPGATLTTITWSGCHLVTTDASGTVTVDITGWLTSSGTPGRTQWHVEDHTVLVMAGTTGQTITEDVSAVLDGDVTVTATEIDGTASSYAVASAMGITAGLRTSLALQHLGYQAAPFCIASGSFTVEQVWDPRPPGMAYATYPDQGWRFDFTGCNQFTVAPGST